MARKSQNIRKKPARGTRARKRQGNTAEQEEGFINPSNSVESSNALFEAALNRSTGHQGRLIFNSPLGKVQRQELAAQIGRVQGNRSYLRLAEAWGQNNPEALAGPVQKDDKKADAKKPANPGGTGPGKIQGAVEQPYTVTGATLKDLAPQLKRFGGYASQTYTALTIDQEVKPVKVGEKRLQIRVNWKITDGVVDLPVWDGYDKASPQAQAEWDRYMERTREHEQKKHVDMANEFVTSLGEEDRVITGSSTAELKQKLSDKQEALGKKLQEKHDGCKHGTDNDAILHIDRDAPPNVH